MEQEPASLSSNQFLCMYSELGRSVRRSFGWCLSYILRNSGRYTRDQPASPRGGASAAGFGTSQAWGQWGPGVVE